MKVLSALLLASFLVTTIPSNGSEFDSYSRTLFVNRKIDKTNSNQLNSISKRGLFRELARMYYQVETADFKSVLSKIIRIKKEVIKSNDEVKGTYHLVLARLNYRIGNIQKAIKLNAFAIALLEKSGSLQTLQLAYCNQAFFLTVSNNKRATLFLEKADKLRRKGIRTYEVLYFSNRSFYELLNGNLDKAEVFCSRAYRSESYLREHSLVDEYRITILFASIAELKGEFEAEDEYLKKAKLLAIESNITDNWKQVAGSQSVNAYQKGNLSQAYQLLCEKDSLQSLIPNREISEYLLQMELDEQMEIEKSEKRLVQNRLESKEIQFITILIFSIFLVLVLIVVLFQRNWLRLTRKSLIQQHIQLAKKADRSNELRAGYSNLVDKIESLMNDKELFQDRNLTLDRFAKKLGTNRTYLSECINDYYQLNYSQWIAKLRIEAAKRYFLDKNYEHWSIEGVSQTVGFSSISSFNSTFKRETGLTPSQFRKLSR